MNRRDFLISTAIASATVAVPFVPAIAGEPEPHPQTVSVDRLTLDGRLWITVRGPDSRVVLCEPYHYEAHKHLTDMTNTKSDAA